MTDANTPDNPLTPQQATDLMKWVIGETRSMLAKLVREDFKLQSGEICLPQSQKQYFISPYERVDSPDLETSSLSGYCGHTQVFIKSALEDIGYAPKCYTIQSLEEVATENHVALTLDLQTTEGTRRYLLDPTFRQFCTGGEKSPGALLAHLPDGEHIIKNLLTEGFVELTPTRAASYLSAFCSGVCPFDSDAAVADFFSNPKDERSLRPVEGLWPPKRFFVEKGWTPRPRS
jgi:hypothetical protein